MKKLVAIHNACVVKPIEAEEETFGNIIVPDLGKETNKFGLVVSVGPGGHTNTGALIPPSVKIGDKVVLPTMGFTRFQFDGEEYFVGPENQVLAVVSEDVNIDKIIAETEVSKEDKVNLTNL
jgi:chaperonin GroES|tara:strand:- start:340 stop:705 length:366 start_codon:yes stop_codon:yes gene_type:complete